MTKSVKNIFKAIDSSLADEFDFLSGLDPVWIFRWFSGKKYLLIPKQRVVISPHKKDELLEWVRSDAFSSNCLGNLMYINGEANDAEMLSYARDLIKYIEYETNLESLEETIKSAKWNLGKIPLEIKELTAT